MGKVPSSGGVNLEIVGLMSAQPEKSEGATTSQGSKRFTVWMRRNSPILGSFILIVSASYVALQISRAPIPIFPEILPQNLAWTYMALPLLPIAIFLILWGTFPEKETKRRTVDNDELESLYSEVARYETNSESSLARKEKEKLTAQEGPVLEIHALPLRQALVELYEPEQELIAKAKRELVLLEEYTSIGEREEGEGWTKRLTEIIKDLEQELKEVSKTTYEDSEKKRDGLKSQLRADLKVLRQTVADYDKTWAKGESIRTSVTYWVTTSVLTGLLIGSLPLVHSQGNGNLTFLHWLVLGVTGALASILMRLQNLDLPELGETQGKQLVLGTVVSVGIGAMASGLLFAAIWGNILDGAAFPDIPTARSSVETGKSLFWAVFAGLSPGVLRRLSQLGESSLGESTTRGSGE